jgi:Protein of unknown function (DUF2877)
MRPRLRVASIGYLVPTPPAVFKVHSVFARACNLHSGDLLVTVVAPPLGGGPSTLVLQAPAAADLRRWFDVGEDLHSNAARLTSRRVTVQLECARRWHPPARRALLPGEQIAAHVELAEARLGQRRAQASSVLERQGLPLVRALARATLELDADAAVHLIERLIGWGEGLTPAGDDFLVGWIAGLDRLALVDNRARFRKALDPAFASLASRTTPIAAHFLRLAVHGHYVEVLERALDALLCEPDLEAMNDALENALEVGATSGADMLSGVLCAVSAWRP